jgi:CRP/FNR family nitrogen fixation transcriptional regulator
MLTYSATPAAETFEFRRPVQDRVLDERSALAEFLPFSEQPVNHARNSQIFAEGESADYVYLLRSGVVRMTKMLNDGRRQISAFHFPGDIFGFEVGLLHSYSAEAVTPCKVDIVSRSTLEASARRTSFVARNLWALAVQELEKAQDHMLLLGRKTAAERVSSFLLHMADRKPWSNIVDIPMSRSDIADYLGLTIETVSRTLSHLEAQGAIQLPSSRRVMIQDRSLLEASDCM